VFNAFFKVIPNFCSCKVNVEFTIVCFDGIDIIGWFESKPGIVWVVWVYGWYCLKKICKRRWKKIMIIMIHEECIVKGNKISLRISNSLIRGPECSSGFKKVMIHTALFWGDDNNDCEIWRKNGSYALCILHWLPQTSF